MSKNRAIIKWNNSNLAILCSKCSSIIKTGKDFTGKEVRFVHSSGMNANDYLPPQYCTKCKYILLTKCSGRTRNKEGYTRKEMVKMCNKLSFDTDKFFEKLGVNTCMVTDGETVTYHHDVELAARLLIENRDATQSEWD